jgi:hypothetical protein
MTGFLPENPGVLVMDVIAEIMRRFHVDNETVTSLAEAFKLSRPIGCGTNTSKQQTGD